MVIGEQARTSYTGRVGHRGADVGITHRRGSRAGVVMDGAGKDRGGERRAVAGNSLTKGENTSLHRRLVLVLDSVARPVRGSHINKLPGTTPYCPTPNVKQKPEQGICKFTPQNKPSV